MSVCVCVCVCVCVTSGTRTLSSMLIGHIPMYMHTHILLYVRLYPNVRSDGCSWCLMRSCHGGFGC